MNSKGFTLMETLAIVIVLGIVFTLSIKALSGTLALGDNKSYELLKDNIKLISRTYILECDNSIIDNCNDYNWNNNETMFYANILTKYGYLNTNELVNPITKENIANCLQIIAKKNNGNLTITLDDSNC